MIEFFKQSWEEVTKEVTWPSWGNIQSSAALVLVASLIFAVIVGVAIDQVIKTLLNLLFSGV
ncbi:MAG: preprotein translocase subunit SecE [Leadbetterella sp.]